MPGNLKKKKKKKRDKNIKIRNQVAIRKSTWFENGHLSVRKTLILIYCFIFKFDYETAQRESSISELELDSDLELESTNLYIKLQTSTETISDYYNYCREICTSAVRRKEAKGGQELTVEIDGAKFGKRKYNRGRVVEGKWVLGGICRETKEVFLEVVERRDKHTLLPIILEKVAQGSTVITDCWKAYDDLKHSFTHLTVNHSLNFVDPNTGAYTQNIENLWWQIKRQLLSTHIAAMIILLSTLWNICGGIYKRVTCLKHF